MYCPNCKAENKRGVKLCANCGAVLSSDSAAKSGDKKKPKAILLISAAVAVCALCLVGIKLIFGYETVYLPAVQYLYNADGTLDGRYEYTYSNNGNMLYSEYYDHNNSLGSRTEYAYDDNGNMISELSYNSNGSLSSQVEYNYDANGNTLSEQYYGSNGSLRHQNEYIYDENGNKLCRNAYAGGSLNYHEDYSYDADGNILSVENYRFDSLQYRTEYTYAADGSIIFVGYHGDGSLDCQSDSVFNDSGYLLSETYSLPDGSSCVARECTYDENGNISSFKLYHRSGSLDVCYEWTYTKVRVPKNNAENLLRYDPALSYPVYPFV